MDTADRVVCVDVRDAVEFIRRRDTRVPDVALILGSGLAHLGSTLESPVAFDDDEIPGYPEATVEGHHGRLLLGSLEGKTVAIIQGRLHTYEGHSVRTSAFPVRLAHGLGAERLIVTNAAGGINPLFRPGTIMFIDDHISLGTGSPIAGPNEDGMSRFTDMSSSYDADWTRSAEALAVSAGIPTTRGVYLWTPGPSYETKAEIRFFGRIGGDAVGMSTVPEVIQARYLGMKVLGISTITNMAAGLSETLLNHEEVLEVGSEIRAEMETLIRAIVRNLNV
ncbi:MAG: purine-nucleoside phosphorylase [Rhodothermales bacterium]|nr:purine-nucleoside phosphorylase [Rhodothermales bacterium]